MQCGDCVIVVLARTVQEAHRMSDNDLAAPIDSRVVRVWDLPTRLFHWLLVAALIGQVTTGKIGGAAIAWHFRIGYCVFGLILFRLVWGFVGGHWSRFANFVRGPGSVLRYLRGQHQPGDHYHVGHNPLGSVSVVAMLALLALQVATGLVADDEIANTGPLNRYVSNAFGLQATAWHKGPGIGLIIALIVLHIGAIVFYRLRKGQDLIRPMFNGDKVLAGIAVPSSSDTRLTRISALAVALACAGLVAAVVRLGG
jgi:cytochrome b